MLPYLPQLCPISSEALKERRQRHRDEYLKGQSLFWDMVMPLKVKTDASVEAERETGRRTSLFVGTSGFRMINRQKGEVEWGIVISKQFQREGLCREAFRASVQYAREVSTKVTSSTQARSGRNLFDEDKTTTTTTILT